MLSRMGRKNDYWRREYNHEEDHTQSSDSSKLKGSLNSFRVDDLLSRILDKVEGSYDMLKVMKADFSSLNNRVNSHADAIKQLEGQLSQLSAQLEFKVFDRGETECTITLRVDNDKKLAVVTRSGKIAVGNVNGNDGVRDHEEEELIQAPESDMFKEKEESHKQSLDG